MGVQLTNIIPKKEITLEELRSREIAIDALNILYQFLSSIRQKDGTPLMDSSGNITSHLSGLFYRTSRLLEYNIKTAFVFDGEPPEFKYETIEVRSELKENALEKWKEALERGDMEEAKRYASATSKITKDMLEESKNLLIALGVPVIQAPSEGEAQAAYMCKKGCVWATGSQDYDALLFGSNKLVRNLTISGKKKLPGKDEYAPVSTELIELENALKSLGINQEQLIIMGILIGTDYNPGGVKGIGPKGALKLVKNKSFKEIFENIEWGFEIEPERILEFFEKPPLTDKLELNWGHVDKEKILKILVDEHEFSQERIEKVLKDLGEARKKQVSKLDKWF